jgi:hypothetical protein
VKMKWLIVILIGCMFLTSCQLSPTKSGQTSTENSSIQMATGLYTLQPLPTPQPGQTTVIGKVIHTTDGSPFQNTVVRLAEVYGEGNNQAYVLDGAHSPGGITDQNGDFIIKDISAREYVMIVGNSTDSDNYVVIHEASGSAIVYNPLANQILNVGSISVELPNP